MMDEITHFGAHIMPWGATCMEDTKQKTTCDQQASNRNKKVNGDVNMRILS